jgi:SAM-dependent methyltransferase
MIGAAGSAFIRANRRASRWLGRHLPQKRDDAQIIYEQAIAKLLAGVDDGGLVVDAGGGRESRIARHRPMGSRVRLVAVDVAEDELARNDDVDERVVADVTKELPFAVATIDVVASQALLEHLADTEAFIAECARTVKPGGSFVALFSSRFSPHAVANRTLPERWTAALLERLVPNSAGRLGFHAYYDRTYPRAICRLLERHRFRVSDVRVSYYQSPYFEFFLPLFVLSAMYELTLRTLRLSDLAAYVVVVAERLPD